MRSQIQLFLVGVIVALTACVASGQAANDNSAAVAAEATGSTESALSPEAGVEAETPEAAPESGPSAEPAAAAQPENQKPEAPAAVPAPQGAPKAEAAPAPGPRKAPTLVKINLSGEVDLRAFLDYVSKATGKNFLYDDKTLAGKVILLAPTEIPEDRLFDLLESLLEYEGFALEPAAGGLVKVRRATEVTKKPMPLLLPEDLDALPDSDKMVTTAYKLKYVGVPEVQTAVGPLVSGGPAMAVPMARSGMLIITDNISNLKRIARVIRWMDDEKNVPKLEIIQCKHSKAETLAGQIARVVRAQEAAGGKPAEQQGSNFDYDPASNSVIVVATEAMLVRVRLLVERLDVEPPASSSTMRMYPLKNTKAKDVAATLKQLAEGMPTGVRAIPGAPQPGRQAGAEQPMAVAIGELKIIGDENTNSIIVFGPADAQRQIEALIQALDKRRPQVLIEALVVQVSGGNNLNLGFELASWGGNSDHGGIGVTAFGFSTYDYKTGTRTIAEDKGLTGAVVNNGQIPVLLRALLVDSGGRIISRPRLLANDNAEATFQSLDESPYTSVSTVTTTTSTAAFSGYQQAGTDMLIKPHISEGDHLILEITLKLSQFTGAAVSGTETTPGVPPPRRSDNLKTEVTVPDQSTIVIGGLSGAHKTETISRVPILGQIPIIGALFSRTVTTQDDSVEYIFLKAQIASREDFSDLKALSDKATQDSDRLRKAPPGMIPEESKEGGGK